MTFTSVCKRFVLSGLLCGVTSLSSAQDMIDLSKATILSSPADVASWPVTVHIDRLTFDPLIGLSFQRSGANWPDYTPPGWGGPIQYTVWACELPQLNCEGFIQMWRERDATGAPLPSDGNFWWGPQAGGAVHDPFHGYVAKAGDNMAFFLSAGNARNEQGVTSVRERSQVVVVRLPLGDSGVFDFPSVTPPGPSDVEQPPAVVVPPPAKDNQPVVTWTHDIDLDALQARVDALSTDLAALTQIVNSTVANFEQRIETLEHRTIPMSCEASAFGIPLHCAIK